MSTPSISADELGGAAHGAVFGSGVHLTRARLTPATLAGAVTVVLPSGIGLAAATTTDLSWWQDAFSALGTYHDLSGYAFNGTLVLVGMLIFGFALRLRIDLRRLGRTFATLPAPIVYTTLLVTIGVSLALVGLAPRNVNLFLHDHAAEAMLYAFVGILLLTPILLRRVLWRLHLITGVVVLTVAASVVLYATGLVSLTLLEAVSFILMVGWVRVLTRTVARTLAASHPAFAV